MKLTVKNIVNLWFSADTPLRQIKIKLHPDVWDACQKTNRSFRPPSGIAHVDRYRKRDKVAFAESVLKELNQDGSPAKSNAYQMA